MEAPAGRSLLRIGELSRRVGVSDHLLRAWESRYGLLQPVRSPGGFRLYSEADESRIRQMQAYLAGLGRRWQDGTASVAMEHFASNVIRGRLAGLARGWGSGHGPQALLACPPGELHDLALMMFGIVLHRNGWRIDYLGANTPVEELARAAGLSRPDLVVLAATRAETLGPLRTELAPLAPIGHTA